MGCLGKRVQDLRGAEGISIYYRYDTNRDGTFSDWHLVPKERLFHSVSDLTTPKTQKFSDIGKRVSIVSSTVAGQRYKIRTVGSTNWTSIGSAIAQVGAVFERNSTALSGSSFQQVVQDFITYSEQKSAESNRIVRFILLSSGSTSANDGGIIIQNNVNGTGFAFLYDQGQARWGYTGSLSSTATTAAPDAFPLE